MLETTSLSLELSSNWKTNQQRILSSTHAKEKNINYRTAKKRYLS